MAYHYTKNEKYLEVAKKVAKYFISNVDDYMPIDFAQPTEPKYKDSSAAAICACGLLEIMKHTTDEEMNFYKEAVDKLMQMLYENCDFTYNDEAILQNCSEMYHREWSRHISLIYGDYYMLEALSRLNGYEVLLY
jgi:unsaturated chondroitin disaccharide hydrolase